MLFRSKSAANMITADIEYARSLSISTGQSYSVVFDASIDEYHIEDSVGTTIAHPVKKGFDYQVSFPDDGRVSNVDITAATFGSTSAIKFDYLGSPYDGDGNPFNSSGIISIQAGDALITISIEAVTGFISISE